MHLLAVNVYKIAYSISLHIPHPSSPIDRAGDALESRRQSFVIIQASVVERKHQTTSDDWLLERVLPKGSGCRVNC